MEKHCVEEIKYVDETGFATHLLLELRQNLGSKLATISRTLNVREGKATLSRVKAKNVYLILAQPVVQTKFYQSEPLGPQMLNRAPYVNGVWKFFSKVEIRTSCLLVPRTYVSHRTFTNATKIESHDSELEEGISSKDQIQYQQFEYYDMPNGQANTVVLELTGIKEGKGYGTHVIDPPLPVNSGIARLLNASDYSDIEKIFYQPKTLNGSNYGNSVSDLASPDHFITIVKSEATPATGHQPVINQTTLFGEIEF